MTYLDREIKIVPYQTSCRLNVCFLFDETNNKYGYCELNKSKSYTLVILSKNVALTWVEDRENLIGRNYCIAGTNINLASKLE